MRSITEHLTLIVDLLARAIGVHLNHLARLSPHVPCVPLGPGARYAPQPPAPPGPTPLPRETYLLLRHRLLRLKARFLALFERWQTNTLPKPRLRPKRPRTSKPVDPTAPKPLRLPRTLGWAARRLAEAPPASGFLESLILNRADELKPFLAAAPQAGRLLRPLCTALGLPLPDYLRLPPRPRRPRQPQPPRAPRPSLNDPTLRWRDWELRAVRAALKKYGRNG